MHERARNYYDATSKLGGQKLIQVELFDEISLLGWPTFQIFHLKTCSQQADKKVIFLQKIPKKLSKIGYPANTDIAPESSKREGYFSGPPKIKFQNTSRQNDVCHTLLSTDKNLQKSGRTYVRNGTDKLDLHTRTERAQAQK